jgi:hypothetical protein
MRYRSSRPRTEGQAESVRAPGFLIRFLDWWYSDHGTLPDWPPKLCRLLTGHEPSLHWTDNNLSGERCRCSLGFLGDAPAGEPRRRWQRELEQANDILARRSANGAISELSAKPEKTGNAG